MFSNSILKFFTASISKHTRKSSILNALDSSPVLVSTSKDVYTNLALEHWLYTNLKFHVKEDVVKNEIRCLKNPVVFIWVDEPSIIIGRHQNPWVESNLAYLYKNNIKLARRHSGGGCVYHDEYNINISIIGARKLFERRNENLKFLAKVLDSKYDIKCETNERHDLIHQDTGFKVSGSAAKLGRFNCYHHFTLLVDSNKSKLSASIRKKQQDFIFTNSTPSKRGQITNLTDIKSGIEVEQVIADLADEYKKLYSGARIVKDSHSDSNASEQSKLDGLEKFAQELRSWDWIYGMTPKFQINRTYQLLHIGSKKRVSIKLTVNKGLFEDILIDSEIDSGSLATKFVPLIGTKFTYLDAMINICKIIDDSKNSSDTSMTGTLCATFLLQLIQESNQ